MLPPNPGLRGVLVGAPNEDVAGEEDAGTVFVLENRSPAGLSPAQSQGAVVQEDGTSDVCPDGHEYAWGLTENHHVGSHLTFYSLVTRGTPDDWETVTLASGVLPGVANGRLLHYARSQCRSCVMFARSPGTFDFFGDEPGTSYGASAAVGFFDVALHDAGENWTNTAFEYLAIGAPFFDGTGGVHIFDRSSYADRLGSVVEEAVEGDLQCDYENADDFDTRIRTLRGGFPTEQFGRSMAAADFNCDGFDDLAVGAPSADLPGPSGTIDDAGAVTVFYGGPLGMGNEGSVTIFQGAGAVGGTAEAGDEFGAVLTVGNFNGARIDDANAWSCYDLAVGTPNEDDGAGEVQIFLGSPEGLMFDGLTIRLGEDGFPGERHDGDRFGHALAGAPFTNLLPDLDDPSASFDDLAIGAPGDETGGSVLLVLGTDLGLDPEFSVLVSQAHPNLELENEEGDEFGYAVSRSLDSVESELTSAIVVGVPGEDEDRGVVAIVGIGTVDGALGPLTGETRTLAASDFGNDESPGDRFGAVLSGYRAFPQPPWVQ